jgi:hypothetical protein
MRFHANNSKTVRKCGKYKQTTIKKLDSVLRMKLFSPLGGVSAIACKTLRKLLENGEIFVNSCLRNTIRISVSGCLMKIFSSLGGVCISISIRDATQKPQILM